MFAVLLAATTLSDPAYNPVLYERLTLRMVAAMQAAADRHPLRAAYLLGLARFIRLDMEIQRGGAISREEEGSFLFNQLQVYQQIVTVANELSDPVLDLELLATMPPLIRALDAKCRWRFRRQACGSLQGLAMWYSYQRDVRPAVARVVGYTMALMSRRPLP